MILLFLVIYSQRFFFLEIQQHDYSFLDTASMTTSARDMPLFVGAGQGTTGTKSIHQAMCELGIPSVHFYQVCFQPLNKNINVDESVHRGIDSHLLALHQWKRLKLCVSEARSVGQVCNSTLSIIESMRNHVVDVITSGVGAIHDLPYTFMLPYVLTTAQESSRETILLFTERNSIEWAKRRIKTHKQTPQLICRDTKSAFDLDYCLLSSRTATGDLLLAYKECKTDQEKSDFILLLEKNMNNYQQRVRQFQPDYHVNFFEYKEKVNMQTIKQGIWKSARRKLPPSVYYGIRSRLKRQHIGAVRPSKLKRKAKASIPTVRQQ